MFRSKSDSIKILALFLHDCRYGERIRGDERRFLEVAKQFKSFGAKISVIEWFHSLQKSFCSEKIYDSIKINPPKLKALWIPYTIFKAIFVSRKLKYDIIYAHNQDIPNMLVGYTLKILFRKPLVVVFHWEYKLFEEGCLRNLKRGKKIFISLLLLAVSLFIRKFIFPKIDHCFTVTDAIKTQLINQMKLQPEKVTVSGNGVDSNKFKPYDNIEKKYDVAYFGRIDFSQKGVDVLLKAWKEVVIQKIFSKLILIGGFNSQEDYKQLVNMLTELDLKGNVEFTGFVGDEEVVKLLNMARIFVLPTRFEGHPLALLEAMSCGLACIVSSAVPVIREYGNSYICISPDNYKELADNILLLLNDDERRMELSRTSRAQALKYQWSQVAEKEYELMVNLIWRSYGRIT